MTSLIASPLVSALSVAAEDPAADVTVFEMELTTGVVDSVTDCSI